MTSTGTISPACAPTVTTDPSLASAASEPASTSPPTDSMTTSTPRPSVISRTRAARSSSGVVDGRLRPEVVRASSFASLPAEAMTRALEQPRHLDSGRADSASCRVDEHPLTLLERRPCHEGVPDGAEGRLDRRRRARTRGSPAEGSSAQAGATDVLGVAARRLDAEHADPLAVHVLRRARTTCTRGNESGRAGRPGRPRRPRYARAQRGHLAGDLEAERVRRAERQARGAVPHVEVDVVDGAGADAHQRLAGARLGNVGTSSSRRTSTPPYSWKRIALMPAVAPDGRGRAERRREELAGSSTTSDDGDDVAVLRVDVEEAGFVRRLPAIGDCFLGTATR